MLSERDGCFNDDLIFFGLFASVSDLLPPPLSTLTTRGVPFISEEDFLANFGLRLLFLDTFGVDLREDDVGRFGLVFLDRLGLDFLD